MKMMTLGPFDGNAWLLGRKIERTVAEWKEPARLAIVALPSGMKHEEYLAAVEDVVRIRGGASVAETAHCAPLVAGGSIKSKGHFDRVVDSSSTS